MTSKTSKPHEVGERPRSPSCGLMREASCVSRGAGARGARRPRGVAVDPRPATASGLPVRTAQVCEVKRVNYRSAHGKKLPFEYLVLSAVSIRSSVGHTLALSTLRGRAGRPWLVRSIALTKRLAPQVQPP